MRENTEEYLADSRFLWNHENMLLESQMATYLTTKAINKTHCCGFIRKNSHISLFL